MQKRWIVKTINGGEYRGDPEDESEFDPDFEINFNTLAGFSLKTEGRVVHFNPTHIVTIALVDVKPRDDGSV